VFTVPSNALAIPSLDIAISAVRRILSIDGESPFVCRERRRTSMAVDGYSDSVRRFPQRRKNILATTPHVNAGYRSVETTHSRSPSRASPDDELRVNVLWHARRIASLHEPWFSTRSRHLTSGRSTYSPDCYA
jgi:hypothetical protein